MIKKYFKNLVFMLILVSTATHAFSASVYLKQVGGPTGTISYDVMLDTEMENVNALAGELSFDRDLVDVYSINTADGVFSNWMVTPNVSNEISLDTKNRINFEGIITGGYMGTVSPYSKVPAAGKVFTVSFVLKNEGVANFSFENIDLRLNDGFATKVNVKSSNLIVDIPKIEKIKNSSNKQAEGRDIGSETLISILDKDSSIEDGKWFAYFNEDISRHTVNHYEVAESNNYSPYDVPPFLWHREKSPYVLKYQSLNNFIHVKAVYNNGDYSYVTLEPVENKRTKDIKVVIIVVLMALLSVIVLLREEKERYLKRNRK